MIYTITLFEHIKCVNGIYSFGKCRSVGYYLTLSDAIKAVTENRKNFRTDKFSYCIVEEVPEGIMEYTPNRYLFEWRNGKFEQIDEPIHIHPFTNFVNH